MSIRTTKSNSGFTIPELLLVLTITAMLLAAVTVAFNASITNYRENEDIFKTVNKARQALSRITTQIRTAGYDHPSFGLLCVPYDSLTNQCELWTPEGVHITYEYRDASDATYPNTLLLVDNDTGTPYVLCDNVTAMSFIKTPTDDGLDCKSVQISITVASGDIERTLSSAAVVRKVLE